MMLRLSLTIIFIILLTIEQVSSQSTRAPASALASRAITGLVLDDYGQPAVGAQIIIDRVGVRNQMEFINTDDAGRFKTPALLPGLYALDVQWPGYVIRPEPARPGFHRAGDHLTINLIKGGVITGRVTDMTGEPRVFVNVSAWRVRDAEGRSVARDYESRRTDDRGVYRLYGLEAGRYVVSAQAGSDVYVGGSEAGEEIPTAYAQ